MAVDVLDMLSYFVVADLLLALHLDAAAVPSTLTVSVEHCSNVWDKLLALYQRRGSYTVHICRYGDIYPLVSGYKLLVRDTCIRQNVSWCKRGSRDWNIDANEYVNLDVGRALAACPRRYYSAPRRR